MDKIRNLFGASEPDDDQPTDPEIPLSDEELEIAAQTKPVRPDFGTIEPRVLQQAMLGATRRLPPLEGGAVQIVDRITFGFGRDIGMVRSNNEDSILTLLSSQQTVDENPDFGLFIVADGAGGHEDGELASAVVSRMVANYVSRHIFRPMLIQHLEEAEDDIDRPPISEVLAAAVKEADEKVQKEVPGGGTTLTAVVTIGDLAHFAHVGDSRAYLITRDKDTDDPHIEQLTRDHSVAARLEEIGQITAQEAVNHPEASRLWKIMGLTDNLEPDIFTRRLPPDCYLVLCSDGMWNMVSQDEIRDAVLNEPTLQLACDKLVAAANSNGGTDNISIVVLHMPGD